MDTSNETLFVVLLDMHISSLPVVCTCTKVLIKSSTVVQMSHQLTPSFKSQSIAWYSLAESSMVKGYIMICMLRERIASRLRKLSQDCCIIVQQLEKSEHIKSMN